MEKASAMLAVLACLLAAFITPSAHAAATYDITQVGDADWVGITDADGNDATKTPLASNGVNVRVTFDVHIDDMSRLAEGDTVTVSFGAASGSHYGPWGLFDSANLPRVLRNRDGVDMFTLTAPNAYTLTMTRTGDAAVGSFDGSVTVATQLWMSNGSATSQLLGLLRRKSGRSLAFIPKPVPSRAAFFPSNDVGSFLTCDTGRESTSCLVRLQR